MTDAPAAGVLGDGPATGTVALAGVVITLQTALLLALGIAPVLIPPVVGYGVLALSPVAAGLLSLAAITRGREKTEWWTPDWRRWVLGMLPPGLNLGIWLGYVFRLREVSTEDKPSGRWRNVAVAAAVVAAVGTAAVRAWSAEGPPAPLVVLVALVALVAVGFDLVAMYYDTRYVTRIIENAGHGWLFGGYHWVALVPLVIPLNLVLVLLYLYRRRTLLNRAKLTDSTIQESAGEETPGPEQSESVTTRDDEADGAPPSDQ